MLYNHGSVYIIETHEFMEPTSPFGKGLQSHELENKRKHVNHYVAHGEYSLQRFALLEF